MYRKVLPVKWPSVTLVKYHCEISIIYHQKQIQEGIMNRFSIKKLFFKISQNSQKNTFVGVSF